MGQFLDHMAKKKKNVPQQNVTSATNKHNIDYWKYNICYGFYAWIKTMTQTQTQT